VVHAKLEIRPAPNEFSNIIRDEKKGNKGYKEGEETALARAGADEVSCMVLFMMMGPFQKLPPSLSLSFLPAPNVVTSPQVVPYPRLYRVRTHPSGRSTGSDGVVAEAIFPSEESEDGSQLCTPEFSTPDSEPFLILSPRCGGWTVFRAQVDR
jgi:hypothetical protein